MKKLTYLLLALLLVCSLPLNVFASETVASQIADIPTVEEFMAMSSEAQLEVYNRTQFAYDAYMDLPEEEKARIDGAEETFEALFTHFNTLIAPAETVEETEAVAIPAAQAESSGKEGDNTIVWIVIVALISTVATLLVRGRRK